MSERSDSPPEDFHLLRLEEVPPDLKKWFEPLVEPQHALDGSYASRARRAILRPSLMLTLTARKEKHPNLDVSNFDKEVRWNEAPSAEEMAKLLKIDSTSISSVQLDKDGRKLRVFLTSTIAPENTNIKTEGWDYRIFPTAINGFDNIAFIQQHEAYPIVDGEAEVELNKMFCGYYFENLSEELVTKTGTMWRRTPKGYKNVKGTWITSSDKLIKKPVSEHVHLCTKGYPLPLTRLFTPWQERVKQKTKNAKIGTNASANSESVTIPPVTPLRQKRNREERSKTPENGASPSGQQSQPPKRRQSSPPMPAIASSSGATETPALQPATVEPPTTTHDETPIATYGNGIKSWLASQTPLKGTKGQTIPKSTTPKYVPNQKTFLPIIPATPPSNTGASQQPPVEANGRPQALPLDDE